MNTWWVRQSTVDVSRLAVVFFALLLIALLVPLMVRADHGIDWSVPPGQCTASIPSHCGPPVDMKTGKLMSPYDCLANMEAAMRAMDPYIYKGTWPQMINDKDRLQAALLWAEVKQACWRKP